MLQRPPEQIAHRRGDRRPTLKSISTLYWSGRCLLCCLNTIRSVDKKVPLRSSQYFLVNALGSFVVPLIFLYIFTRRAEPWSSPLLFLDVSSCSDDPVTIVG